MDSARAAAVVFPNFTDVAGARALLFLADSSPAPSPPPPPPALSDEVSCYSGSSASYSATSARSCVSDSAQRGRPVDPLRVLAVVASLRRIDPKVLAKATNTLFQGESSSSKKRKGVWIHIEDGDEDGEDEGERNSAVASEGSAITEAASAGSTATSGKSHRPPRASGGGGGGNQLPRRADSIMKWLSRPEATPATETAIRAAVGDNNGTSKALRWLLKRQGCLRRTGNGGCRDPYVYMESELFC
uniref:HTH three-helical bundle domain-containing protein n=1 Tax=Leersia perrieri TaxID=77586 RepID=A0A0D9X2D0_9ORYZ